MAMWDGGDFFTADDGTLLRAIQIVDGGAEGHPHLTSYSDSMIYSKIISKPGFKIIHDNEHLRTLLRAFLEENIYVAGVKIALREERERGFLGRLIHRGHRKALETQLREIEGPRDEAFKKYEMLRRLTDWENTLLKRVPY